MRRLAIFWLLCAAAGFSAATSLAFLLAVAIDRRPAPSPSPSAALLRTFPHQRGARGAEAGN